MEAIKKILNPGHQKDDETLYGANSGDHSTSKQPENKSLSSHAGPTSTLENATAGTLPTSADPDTQYSRDATTAEGAGATGLGSEHYNSSGVPASNTEIYGPALTHSLKKNEPTSALNAAGLESITPATNSAYPDSLSTAPSSTNPNAGLPSVSPATNSAYPDSLSTGLSSINPIGSPEHDSHFGRDAAIAGGAGATGLGAYEASKHRGHTSSTTQPPSNDGFGSAKILGTTTTGSTVRSEAGAPGSTGIAPGQPIGTTSPTHHDSHHGRDAALAGGAGAAGLGAYEAKKHHDASSTSQPIHQSTAQQLGPGAALGTGSRDFSSGSGISSSTTASRPDATSFASNASIKSGVLGRVTTSELSKKNSADLSAAPATGGKFTEGLSSTSANPTQTPHSSTGDRAFPLSGGQTSGSANPSSTSHLGRDAAIVGGTGLAGAGAAEAWKHHDNSGAPTSATDAGRNVAAGRQGRPGAWRAVTDNDAREEPAEWKDHTHGGIGHEYKGDPCGPHEDGKSSVSGLPPYGPHQTQAANLLDPSVNQMPGAFPRSESDVSVPSNYGGAQTGVGSDPIRRADNIVGSHGTSSSDRHLGRDAAVAGGIGAAGLGAYEASKKHDTTGSGFGTKTSSTTGSTAAGGPFSSSTSTAPNTGLAATDAKIHGENDSHTGRNVALGGGAAAAGLGGYEVLKHHENQQSIIPPSTTAASSLPAHSTTSGTTGAPYSSSTSTTAAPTTGETASKLRDDHDSHTGRNAVLGGGAAAAGLGGYEAYKHHDQKANISGQTPAGTSVRNDGVPVSGQQSNLTHNQKENIPGSSTAADDKHHTGRDVAAVGAAGAAGAGAHHEYSKHEAEKAAKEQHKAEEKLAKEREHEASKRHKEHEKELKHHEKDAAKHEKEVEKEKKPSLISRILHRKKDKHGNDIDSEEEDTKHGVAIAEHDGHNKLHKDPPAGHPAHDTNARSSRTYFTTAAGPSLEERARAEAVGSSTAGTGHIPAEGHNTTHGTSQGGIVTDPHTGLPMNVGKYGDGHGGTDGNQAILGANTHGGAASDVKATDWEAIKKANTPY